MGVPLLLQFCIALFTGMVAATFVPPVRRSIPRPVEVILWVALITVCAVGVVSITDPNARELSAAAAWGADQVINTIAGLMLAGVGGWLSDHRFALASWLVIIAGVDIFALMFLGSWRSAHAWQPRVRLREWMEMPAPAPVEVAPGRRALVYADPLADVNQRVAAAASLTGANVLARMARGTNRLRRVTLRGGTRGPARTAAAGGVEPRSQLDGLRDATAHLRYAARAWYAAAGEPAIAGLATRASDVMHSSARASHRAGERAGHVIDMQALLDAQSIGWYGPFSTVPAPTPLEGDTDSDESKRQDRLAS